MGNSTEQKPETKTSSVQIGNLPQQEKELKVQEAKNLKGGAGVSGSALTNHIGEEIPQKHQK